MQFYSLQDFKMNPFKGEILIAFGTFERISGN